MSTRYPPWDAKASLRICNDCPYCHDPDSDRPCHADDPAEAQP